ncbi:MAG: hypothetical protein ACREK2_02215 [Gemmatimonadota bacterium]
MHIEGDAETLELSDRIEVVASAGLPGQECDGSESREGHGSR